MYAITVKKQIGNELIIVGCKLTWDQKDLTVHTLYYDGRFSHVLLNARYSVDPIEMNEALADEVCDIYKSNITDLLCMANRGMIKAYRQAFNRRHFFPNRWKEI